MVTVAQAQTVAVAAAVRRQTRGLAQVVVAAAAPAAAEPVVPVAVLADRATGCTARVRRPSL